MDNIINGVKVVDLSGIDDFRGEFVKIYKKEDFSIEGIEWDVGEIYYSVSKKNVIRGMHFQLPPYEHKKLVYVMSGSILDVLVDLRKKSKTYKKCMSVELKENSKKAIYIPEGIAHGFKSLENNTCVIYCVSGIYMKEYDTGIYWNSIGVDWDIENPIISERDRKFVYLEEFNSPF